MKADYLIVGSGLTGAVIARKLTDAGENVLVIERRSHVGGNVHDYFHPSGIRIHTYGPHYFRTNSEETWRFVNRFDNFYEYEAVVKSYVDGQYENWPIAESYINRVVGKLWEPAFRGLPSNFEQASLAIMPRLIYQKFVKGYTEKQWGRAAETLSAELVRRFDVREDNDPRLKRHKYQGIPVKGYADFMKEMLNGIPLILNCDYLKYKDTLKAQKTLIFTGPIDEFFKFDIGRLSYRSQKREHIYFPDVDYALPCGQVNNPKADAAHIRTLEWKHMMSQSFADRITGTLLTQEIPFSPKNPDRYEYPFPDEANKRLYEQYRARAESLSGTLICGRLGEYRYYDMDHAIERAIYLSQKLIKAHPSLIGRFSNKE